MFLLNCIKHFLSVRHRLVFANLVGGLCFLILPTTLSLLTRFVVSWNLLAWIYLVLLWMLMLQKTNKDIHHTACKQDESAATVLMLVSVGAMVSLLVIFLELSTAKQSIGLTKIVHFALTFSTLIGAWLLVPTAFAIHYAHLFYLSPSTKKPVVFPDGNLEPSYWDFIYFSFTIAVASQTADIAINTTQARKLVTLQSILSFVFNISILGLCINVSASLV
jgi:uncharacterized membrane protein